MRLAAANGSLTMQLGGEVSDSSLPAVELAGECRGPYRRFEIDLPAPGARGSAAAAAGLRRLAP